MLANALSFANLATTKLAAAPVRQPALQAQPAAQDSATRQFSRMLDTQASERRNAERSDANKAANRQRTPDANDPDSTNAVMKRLEEAAARARTNASKAQPTEPGDGASADAAKADAAKEASDPGAANNTTAATTRASTSRTAQTHSAPGTVSEDPALPTEGTAPAAGRPIAGGLGGCFPPEEGDVDSAETPICEAPESSLMAGQLAGQIAGQLPGTPPPAGITAASNPGTPDPLESPVDLPSTATGPERTGRKSASVGGTGTGIMASGTGGPNGTNGNNGADSTTNRHATGRIIEPELEAGVHGAGPSIHYDTGLPPGGAADTSKTFAAELQALLPGTAADLAPATTGAPIDVPTEGRLNANPQSPEFAGALGAQLSTFIKDGVHHARLELNPSDMGPVTVQIQLDGSNAKVHLAAENADTRQALEQAMPQLAGSLREAGLTLAGGGVYDQPQPQAQPQQQDSRQALRDGLRDGSQNGLRGVNGQGALSGADANRAAAQPFVRSRGVVDLVA